MYNQLTCTGNGKTKRPIAKLHPLKVRATTTAECPIEIEQSTLLCRGFLVSKASAYSLVLHDVFSDIEVLHRALSQKASAEKSGTTQTLIKNTREFREFTRDIFMHFGLLPFFRRRLSFLGGVGC